jgi:hypothetical protein
MLSADITFILPTCPGIPDGTWMAAGKCIDYVTGVSIKLLSAGFVTQLLFSGLSNSTNGRVDVAGMLRLIGKTLGLFLFLNYSKRIFFTWEVFMDELCPHIDSILPQPTEQQVEWPSGFRFLTILFQGLLGLVETLLFIFTIDGAIIAVNFLKSILLVFLCIVGPLSAGLTLFPLFSKSFSTWIKSYITVSFQAFTLEVFSILNNTSMLGNFKEVGGTGLQAMISLILFFAVLMTPVWTSMFVNSVMTPNLMGALGQGLQNVTRGLTRFLKP